MMVCDGMQEIKLELDWSIVLSVLELSVDGVI